MIIPHCNPTCHYHLEDGLQIWWLILKLEVTIWDIRGPPTCATVLQMSQEGCQLLYIYTTSVKQQWMAMDILHYNRRYHSSPRGWIWDLVTSEPKIKVKSLVWLRCECMYLNIIDSPWRLATISYVSNKFIPTMSGMGSVSSHPTTSFITQRMDMRYDDYVASNEVKKRGRSSVWLNIFQVFRFSRKVVNWLFTPYISDISICCLWF